MRIAAVVVTHNRPLLLQHALAALRLQTRPLDAIYVVDNASTDGLGDLAGAVVLRSDTNLGGAGGFALGMTHAFAAGHDWLWLLDDDALARPDALACLLAALATPALATLLREPGAAADTDTAGASTPAPAGAGADADSLAGRGPCSTTGPGTEPDAAPAGGCDAAGAGTVPGTGSGAGCGALCGTVREFGAIARRHRRRFHALTGIERPLPRAAYTGPPCRTDSASFVGLLVSSQAIAAAGFPEAALFLAYDDTEYSLRLGRAGLPLWLVPTSVVEHLRERDARLRAGPFGARHYFTVRNRIAVARRYGRLSWMAGGTGVLFGIGLWLACRGTLRRGAVRILLRAIGDGWRGRLGPFPAALAHSGGAGGIKAGPAPPRDSTP